MTLGLVGVQLDSRLLSQGLGDPSSCLVLSVRAMIGQGISNRRGRSIAWTGRQNQANLPGTVARDNEQWPSLIDADTPSGTANLAGASSGWHALDPAAKYMFYSFLFAAPPHPYWLNVFA